MPLPSDETTPPVMKMYLADFDSNSSSRRPSCLTSEHPRCSIGGIEEAAVRVDLRVGPRLATVTPLALALVLVAAFAHAGWNALVQAGAGRRGVRLDADDSSARLHDPGRARPASGSTTRRRVSLGDRADGHRERRRRTRLLRAPAARLRDRRPLARLPAGAWHRADLRDRRRDRDPRRAARAARAGRHRRDRLRRRPAARDARTQPWPRARLRPPHRAHDRHLHRVGRPRRARLARGAALLPADHER